LGTVNNAKKIIFKWRHSHTKIFCWDNYVHLNTADALIDISTYNINGVVIKTLQYGHNVYWLEGNDIDHTIDKTITDCRIIINYSKNIGILAFICTLHTIVTYISNRTKCPDGWSSVHLLLQ